MSALHGWVDSHTILASDTQHAYWIAEEGKPQQTISLNDIYGNSFQITGADTIRVNPLNPDLLLVSANFIAAPTGAPTDSRGLAAGFFLYEVRANRRVTLSPSDTWSRSAEWSRDGLQIYFTRRNSPLSLTTVRIFWDASGLRRYLEGSDLVIGQ